MMGAGSERSGIAGDTTFRIHQRRHSRVLQSPLAASRASVMLQHDNCTRDDRAVERARPDPTAAAPA
jgi:hypothetical protein